MQQTSKTPKRVKTTCTDSTYRLNGSGEFVVIRLKLPNQPIHVRLWEIVPRLDDSLRGAFRVVRLKGACGQIVERVVGRLIDAGLNNAQAGTASALC